MTDHGLPFNPVMARELRTTVRPFHHETVRSYLDRLAAINNILSYRMINPSFWVTSSLDLPELLAVLSGRTLESLHRSFPELAGLTKLKLPPAQAATSHWACRRCVARTGLDHPVRVWLAGEKTMVCTRHKLWIGTGVTGPREQFDLAGLPHVVQAQLSFNRRARRRGERTCSRAYQLCRPFVRGLANHGGGLAVADDRLRDYRRHDQWHRGAQYSPLRCAALFPHTVEAVAIMTSPHWRRLILSRQAKDHEAFLAEFRRRIPLGPPAHTAPEPGWTSQLADIAEEVERAARRTGEDKLQGA